MILPTPKSDVHSGCMTLVSPSMFVVKLILAADVSISFPAVLGLNRQNVLLHVPASTCTAKDPRKDMHYQNVQLCAATVKAFISCKFSVLGRSFLDIRTDKCFIKKKKIQKIRQSKCQRENQINRTETIESQITQNNLREEFHLSDKGD